MHGAFFLNRKSYGPVQCGFKEAEILRCGSVRFSGIVNPTVRFGAVIYPTVRFGAVLKIVNATVRLGAFNRTEPIGQNPDNVLYMAIIFAL